jgi:phospholipid/cholesterol/gamma-HCH transport system substrate-binding protein
VAGLGVGSQVLFNGVPVGTVSSIAIDRRDSRRVKVKIHINREVPVRADSIATIGLQGITGVALVDISPGTPGAPLLVRKPGGLAPKIPSQPSELTSVIQSVPQVVKEMKTLIEHLDRIASPDNVRNLKAILANTATITSVVASERADLTKTIAAAAATSAKLARLVDTAEASLAAAHATFSSTARLTKDDVPKLVDNMRATSRALTAAANQVNAMVAENRASLHRFSTTGLPRLTRLLSQTDQVVQQLSRTVQKIDDNPSVLFYGEKVPERTLR